MGGRPRFAPALIQVSPLALLVPATVRAQDAATAPQDAENASATLDEAAAIIMIGSRGKARAGVELPQCTFDRCATPSSASVSRVVVQTRRSRARRQIGLKIFNIRFTGFTEAS